MSMDEAIRFTLTAGMTRGSDKDKTHKNTTDLMQDDNLNTQDGKAD
ncbi:MAG: hypothetical protein ISEC1_P1895 [Thiomicrorhabdus sp.]|nr:MAG: hypothetical protein ISEC1_P1895 [Thiomicrorhabdus sp.]